MKLFSDEHSYLQTSHFFWITGVMALVMSCATSMRRIFIGTVDEESILKAIHEHKVRLL